MRQEKIPLGFSGLFATPGSHIAYPFQSESERFAAVVSFIETGLKNSEAAVTAVSEYSRAHWESAFTHIDLAALPSGQMEILTPSDLFSDGSAIAAIQRSITSAKERGWEHVRICTSFNHLLSRKENLPGILLADDIVNTTLDNATTMLCTFDAKHLHPKVLDACLQVHPYVTDGHSVCKSPDFIEAGEVPTRIPAIMERLALPEPAVELSFADDLPVIMARGEIDIVTSPDMESLAKRVMLYGHKHLIVDLTRTRFMDASSISALARIAVGAREHGGELAICDSVEPARRIFTLSRLNEFVPVRASLSEAAGVFFA